MKRTLTQYFHEERQRVIEQCITCGKCVINCPIIQYTPLKGIPPKDIQASIIEFFQTGRPNEVVFTRAFSCMQCFQCVKQCCPQGLDPMLMNEMIKCDYRDQELINISSTDPKENDAVHRILASIQISRADYTKLLTLTPKTKTQYVFFPGCNVYFQPEKLLSALDIMDMITDEYAFVPGLDFCCGNVHLYSGNLEKAQHVSQELLETLASYQPETVILWCPTCQCRFDTTLSKMQDFPFKIVSFPQFLAESMHKLSFSTTLDCTATVHEACKAAFTGVDLTGPRNVLQQLPGVELIEMLRHGENTVCCGSGAIDFFPESFEQVRDERLEEAVQTQADVLVDVCHYCHEVFVAEEAKYTYTIRNYVTLVAEALGIEREDTFKKYKQWADVERITKDARPYIDTSPYSYPMIREAIKKTFIPLHEGC